MGEEKKMLSLVVPAYNEEAVLEVFYRETERVTARMDVEIEYLFVDDGSKDRTLSILREMAAKDKRVHYVSFSRNFGKEAAIYAGLQNAVGDYVVIMDVDLQDPPTLLPQMLEAVVKDGYDCVGTRRVSRKGEPPVRSFFARLFYKLINRVSKTEIVDGARDYQLMSRKVVEAILSMGEYNRFSKGIFGWVGYRSNGWNMRILSARQEKQNGHSGNYYCMRWMVLSHFQLRRLCFRQFSVSCSVLLRW